MNDASLLQFQVALTLAATKTKGGMCHCNSPQDTTQHLSLDLIQNLTTTQFPTSSLSLSETPLSNPELGSIYYTGIKGERAEGKKNMGRIFVVELEGRTYRCKFCGTHLALPLDLVSRAFHCRRGKAYLFNNAVNITIGPLEERMMLSGMHTVADVFCCCCGQIVGWKYEAAHEGSQKYKEGKFVLERGRIVDDFSAEVFIDIHHDMSDGEDA